MKKGLFIMCMVFAGFAATGVTAQSKTKGKVKIECCTQNTDCTKNDKCCTKKSACKNQKNCPKQNDCPANCTTEKCVKAEKLTPAKK